MLNLFQFTEELLLCYKPLLYQQLRKRIYLDHMSDQKVVETDCFSIVKLFNRSGSQVARITGPP